MANGDDRKQQGQGARDEDEAPNAAREGQREMDAPGGSGFDQVSERNPRAVNGQQDDTEDAPRNDHG